MMNPYDRNLNLYYKDDLCTVVQGDCLDVMRIMAENELKFDAIITDPPYGTTACRWDIIVPFKELWESINKLRKEITTVVLFGSEPFSSYLRLSNIAEYRYDWYWYKNCPTGIALSKTQPMRSIEEIMIFSGRKSLFNKQKMPSKITDRRLGKSNGRFNSNLQTSEHFGKMIFNKTKNNPENILLEMVNPRNVLEINVVPRATGVLHPTQKPVELMEYLIKTYTNKGDIILDFTCGSGTTLVAAKNLSVNCYGIEKEEKYCKVSKNRLDGDTSWKSMTI